MLSTTEGLIKIWLTISGVNVTYSPVNEPLSLLE